ncbi:glycosyltransferase family 4 protein [Candidatus Electronema sp. PJ]|uniref:glycosyltransferase family 4 protein n=1 Tax=Candidatus Electronema sp. PJ TaxID=3401572 RepID=UPI003AA81E5E
MIKLLGLALYGPLAASTRYRLEQYKTGLAEYGIDLHLQYLLGDEYLRRRVMGTTRYLPFGALLQSGSERIALLLRQQHFAGAIVYAELFPFLPGWLERLLLSKPYLYDFDDAFYLKYRQGKWAILQPLLANKFDTLMAGAAAVTAGSGILADYARTRNRNTFLLPTVVDTERYRSIPRTDNQTFTVGWIGSPTTAPYLAQLSSPLTILGKEAPLRLVVVGGKAPAIPGIIVEEIPWSAQTEITLINSFDVGIMPLTNDAWAKGKCAFKLIQYLACGIPAVASRVGGNLDVLTSDCGMLVDTLDEWVEALRFFRDKQESRLAMGQAGRARVEQHYSLHRNIPILAEIICKTVVKET